VNSKETVFVSVSKNNKDVILLDYFLLNLVVPVATIGTHMTSLCHVLLLLLLCTISISFFLLRKKIKNMHLIACVCFNRLRRLH